MVTSLFHITEHLVDAQYLREYPHATTTQDAPLKLSVKRYAPIDNPTPQPGDPTIIAAGGCQVPKEVYEPLWEELLERSRQQGFRIRAIWIANPTNLGVSGIHNEKYLGNDPSWIDHSRDLLLMVNHFRDDMPQPLIGFGHSMGAAQMIFLTLMHPRLFSSLALVEPFVVERGDAGSGPQLTLATANKQDVWSSADAYAQKIRKLFKFWDPRVLDRYVQYGYRHLPTAIHPDTTAQEGSAQPVTLATTKHQEVFMYTRANFNRHKQLGSCEDDGPSPPHDPLFVPDMLGPLLPGLTFYRPEPILAWKLLPYIRPRVIYLIAGSSPLAQGDAPEKVIHRTGTDFGGSGGVACGRVCSATIPNAGHTLAQEKPTETAEALAPWIRQELQRWREDERRIAEGWDGLSVKEKSTYSGHWKAMLDELPKSLQRNKAASKL